jgi:hypothetical protein
MQPPILHDCRVVSIRVSSECTNCRNDGENPNQARNETTAMRVMICGGTLLKTIKAEAAITAKNHTANSNARLIA